MTDQPANPNVFALISAYRRISLQARISKAGIAKLASRIDNVKILAMLLATMLGDLARDNYYSVAMLFDGVYMALIVEEELVIVESETGQVQDIVRFNKGVLGVASFRDLLVVFFRSKRIDFYRVIKTGSTKLLWKTLDVWPIQKLPNWHVFPEKYRISISGMLYLIDNEFKLWNADLNKLNELKASESCHFFEIGHDVVDPTLGWNNKDIYYLTEEGTVMINKKSFADWI